MSEIALFLLNVVVILLCLLGIVILVAVISAAVIGVIDGIKKSRRKE